MKEFEIEEDIEDIEVEEENVLITQNIVAKGDEAKYVLENSQTRALIMDDLAELGNLDYRIFRLSSDKPSFSEFFLLGLGASQNVPKDLKTDKVGAAKAQLLELIAPIAGTIVMAEVLDSHISRILVC